MPGVVLFERVHLCGMNGLFRGRVFRFRNWSRMDSDRSSHPRRPILKCEIPTPILKHRPGESTWISQVNQIRPHQVSSVSRGWKPAELGSGVQISKLVDGTELIHRPLLRPILKLVRPTPVTRSLHPIPLLVSQSPQAVRFVAVVLAPA
jgi:hypothetical protein